MKENAAQSVNADLRGFTYALAPYMRKQEWQMERLENRLARLRQSLAESREQRAALDLDFQSQVAHLQLNWQPRPDPHMHQRGLGYLAQLRGHIQEKDREIEALCEQKALLQADCVAQQRKIDGLKEHRADAIQEYVNDAARAAAAEADRSWIGRLYYRTARGAESFENLP
ncbi:hypothetical protein AVME950_07230 [Acidovorax sp. SUPP950]|uniref:hypothetical protein n=1 Tax=Acidovorax sp. SUPP950 TaxID=511901 RepID=UPI0023C3BA26|nr:hypothetical protein [Acidovorax sp. SUPP950]GKS74664.1 hypothetical protein AVME950_07230 [Acidovorax sp. SUPP950]